MALVELVIQLSAPQRSLRLCGEAQVRQHSIYGCTDNNRRDAENTEDAQRVESNGALIEAVDGILSFNHQNPP